MASRFWVGGTGTWDASDTSHWSATSGGSSGASVPTSSDDVTFNGSSGGGTCTVSATANCANLTTGAFTGTLNFNGQTINITGSSGWNASGSGTRTITFGASTVNISASSTGALTLTTTTNQTWNYDTSTIVFTGNGAGISFTTSSSTFTFYNVTFTSGGAATNVLAGINYVFNNLTVTGSANKTCGFTIPNSKTITVNGTLTLNGNSATNRLLVSSTTNGTAGTISIASAPTISNADFMDITGSGAGSWNISGITGNSGDCGGNSGITFTTASTQTATGTASFTWSTHGWTSRVPLPQDDVVINNAFVAGRTVTSDMPRLGKTITFGCSGSPTFTLSANGALFGGLDLTGVATFTSTTNELRFQARSSFSLTSAGLNLNCPILLRAPSGTIQLADNLAQGTATSRSFSLRAGTLDLNGKTLTNFGTFTASFAENTTRSITGGGGTIDLKLNTATTVFTGGSSNFTTSGTFTIKISGSTTNARTFSGAGATYSNLWFSNATGAGQLNILGSNTFNDIKCTDTNTQTIKFQSGNTQTVTTFTVSGAASNKITIDSCTGAGAASTNTHTLTAPTKNNANPISCDYLNIQHSIAKEANTWYAGTNSTDNQAVATAGSGWVFTAPVIVSANKLLALLGVG